MLQRTRPSKISCMTLDYNTKYGILGTQDIVMNPLLLYLSYFSSCCSAKQLLSQRSGPEEVRQCRSSAVLASREWGRFVRGRDNLFRRIDLASFMDLYFRTWSLCGEGVGCGSGPWYKGDKLKKILNKLFLIAKKGATSKRFSTSCFLLLS